MCFGDGSTLREAFGSRRQTVRRRRVAFLSMTATGTISLCNETRATELSEFFVDGVISDTAVSTSGLMTTAFTSIGRIEDTGGSPNHFVGELDDLRIYSRLLSEVEIEALAAFDVVAPRVQSVVISGENVDPADLPKGPSPTTWSQQRTMIDNLQINFTEPVSLTAADIRLVNLGVNAPVDADSDFVITNQSSQRGRAGLHLVVRRRRTRRRRLRSVDFELRCRYSGKCTRWEWRRCSG